MMRIYVAISAIFVLTTLLLIILYKNIPVKSQEVQVDEIVEDIVEEEIPVPDSDSEYDSDSEDEDEILNGTTQGSSIKPPREKSPPKISQPQPIAPIRLPVRPSSAPRSTSTCIFRTSTSYPSSSTSTSTSTQTYTHLYSFAHCETKNDDGEYYKHYERAQFVRNHFSIGDSESELF